MSKNYQVFLSYDEVLGKLREANGIDGELKADNVTEVAPGDTIEWILASESNIFEVSNIYADPQNSYLFSVGPNQHNNAWAATINPLIPITKTGQVYLYNIDVRLIDGGNIKNFDPKITVAISNMP